MTQLDSHLHGNDNCQDGFVEWGRGRFGGAIIVAARGRGEGRHVVKMSEVQTPARRPYENDNNG